jgi:hypothetical protein
MCGITPMTLTFHVDSIRLSLPRKGPFDVFITLLLPIPKLIPFQPYFNLDVPIWKSLSSSSLNDLLLCRGKEALCVVNISAPLLEYRRTGRVK